MYGRSPASCIAMTVLILSIFFSVLTGGISCAETGGSEEVVEKPLVVTEEGGLISVEADDELLEDVLQEISDKTGVEFTVKDDTLLYDLISVSVTNQRLPDALRVILRDYSFIVRESDEGRTTVLVLASLSPHDTPDTLTERTIKRSAGIDSGSDPLPERDVVGSTTGRPETLNECEPLDVSDDDKSASMKDCEGGRTGRPQPPKP